jgi:uncharacterized protein (TIGR03084 family)
VRGRAPAGASAIHDALGQPREFLEESEALHALLAPRERALLERWHGDCERIARSFGSADPRARVPWGGPDMSARSSISARLMETWAYGQAVYDRLGVVRVDSDRIRSIAVLGVKTFA